MTKYLKLLMALIALSAAGFAVSGCNTTAGIGQDLEAAGDAIQDKAEEEKGY